MIYVTAEFLETVVIGSCAQVRALAKIGASREIGANVQPGLGSRVSIGANWSLGNAPQSILAQKLVNC